MPVPGRGFAKAQGLYQLVRLRVEVAQATEELVGSGVPPGLNGSRIRKVLAPPPDPAGAVVILGVTEKGLPVCAEKVKLVAQPPAIKSNALLLKACVWPAPKGSA